MAPDQNAEQSQPKRFVLPLQVITKTDITRLIRELEGVESHLLQASIKHQAPSKVLEPSDLLVNFVSSNALDITKPEERQRARDYLAEVKDKGPVVHLSFAARPSIEFLMKILEWFRRETHPEVVFRVGLKPNIAAGCFVRTTNKYFDFSIHKNLQAAKPKLIKAIGGNG